MDLACALRRKIDTSLSFAIVPLSRWWYRVEHISDGIAVTHASLIRRIVDLAYPMRVFCKPPSCTQSSRCLDPGVDAPECLSGITGADSSREDEVIEVVSDPAANIEIAVAIDPAEAAEVAVQAWASSVEALCSKQQDTSTPPSSELSIVFLSFARDDSAFDEVVMNSQHALRALETVPDVKPE